MALDRNEQVKSLIEKSKNILIVFQKEYTIDSLASSLALGKFLQDIGKEVCVVCDGFEKKSSEDFLYGVSKVESGIKNIRKFIIDLDLKKTGVETLGYDVAGDSLKIFITPKDGFFDESHVSTSMGDYSYDLIIAVDSPDLDSLGSVYEKHSEMFAKLPIVNIDNDPGNEQYGQVDLVDVKAVSCAQVVAEFMDNTFDKSIDSQVATLLLAGIMSATKAFRSATVTPHALATVSGLLKKGAEREKVVTGLYRSKTLATLKLWGRVLARLRHDSDMKLVWSMIPNEDFVKSGAGESDVKGVVEELISSVSESDLVLIFFEKIDKETKSLVVCCQLHASAHLNAIDLTRKYRSVGNRGVARFCLKDSSLLEAEKDIISEIRQRLAD